MVVSTFGVVIVGAATLALTLSGCSPAAEIASPCEPDQIEQDLDVARPLLDGNPTIAECTGDWAVIRWDVPGDTQRIVHRAGSTWVDYVRFPHDQCWSQAEADGVPESFRPYFTPC